MDFSIRLRKPEDGPTFATGGFATEAMFGPDPRWAPRSERKPKVAAHCSGNQVRVPAPAIEQTEVNHGNR